MEPSLPDNEADQNDKAQEEAVPVESVPDQAIQNEAARLDSLRRYNVLDTAPEGAFDDITRLAAQICQTPISLVSFVDSDRQWFKSRYGLAITETPRRISFCTHTIQQTQTVVISDALNDARFAANPLVIGPPRLRFYAAAPLITSNGLILGTLCVLDHVPRQLSAVQIEALTILSRQVMAQLELRSLAKTQINALTELGYELSAANTPNEAARTVVEAAYVLLPWDACSLDLYSEETGHIQPVLSMDTIGNRRVEVPHAYTDTAPSPMARKTLMEGGQLMLRPAGSSAETTSETTAVSETTQTTPSKTTDASVQPNIDLVPFGDVNRSSASLLFVPVRSGLKKIGVLSIQSYKANAYNAEKLTTLQGLADHCGSAFVRITMQQTLARREEEERLAGEKLTALLAVSNQLSKSDSLESLCRQAVELGRTQLGFDRLGLWFLTQEPGIAVGSFGVDETGHIRNESHSIIYTEFASDMTLMLSRSKPYLFENNGPLYNECGELVGHGFHAMAPLWDGEKAIGYVTTDNYLLRQVITERQCELLSLYAATLGHLCSRLRTEAELRKEKRFADTAIDSLPGIFYFFDQQGQFLRWSQNLEKVTGYTAAEIARMHPLDFFKETDREIIAEGIQTVFAEGEATAEASFVSKDGQTTPYFFTGRHTMLDDTSYLVGMGIDISERKRLEEQLLQSQKMEGIGRLAGGIAHDFNNLLTAIIGYADLTKDELSEDHPAYSYVQNVFKAAERASTLTSQLLAFARKQIIAPSIISLNELIMDTGAILRRLIGEDVELIVLPQPELWPVKADFNQFSHVLINLAVNARDAMPSGGSLTIETANINLDADYARRHADVKPGDYAMLVVSDTGVGMDVAIQQHIFEPFFTTKGLGKGTGLGLATCYGIVKQSGGHIWIYSEPGQGTAFKIYLPRVADASVHAVSATEETDIRGGTETILLVEDEVLVLDFAVRALRKRGYTVIEAPNGHEALRQARSYTGHIDLVVTDVVMLQMSGKAMAEQFHLIRPETRILYASGYTDSSIVAHGVLEAGVAFLQKPYTFTSLTRKVRDVLDI